VGISEGGGSATGLTGWILAQQGWFEHQLSLAVRAFQGSANAVWPLVALSFTYGVFHAAGPGHGKAVLTSYMVANERAYRRGVALSLVAALLQGLVAIALVGVLALGLHATAQRMKDAAALVEWVSFLAIALFGAVLVWRKGRVLARLLKPHWQRAAEPPVLFAAAGGPSLALGRRATGGGYGGTGSGRFVCVAGDADYDPACAHCQAIDPGRLMARRFSLADAASTVFAAGLRPCSGAILVLVFSLARGVFAAGILSVFAMSIGVALTTAALASVAVLLKGVAERWAGRQSRGAVLAGAAIEFTAAACVLGAGLLLLAGITVAGA
jgi:nickel/cobalt transporter (NicO) family protein